MQHYIFLLYIIVIFPPVNDLIYLIIYFMFSVFSGYNLHLLCESKRVAQMSIFYFNTLLWKWKVDFHKTKRYLSFVFMVLWHNWDNNLNIEYMVIKWSLCLDWSRIHFLCMKTRHCPMSLHSAFICNKNEVHYFNI